MLEIYKLNLSEFLTNKKREIISVIKNTKDKPDVYNVFRDISNYIYSEYVSRTRFLNKNNKISKLKLQIKELKKENIKFKQTLKLLRIK